jgi:hypothetical protein
LKLLYWFTSCLPWFNPRRVLSAILRNATSMFCYMFSMLCWLPRNCVKNCSAVYGGGGGGGSRFSFPVALPPASVVS